MKNIIEFENIDEYKKYMNSVSLSYISSGAEGKVYKTKDNKCIKTFYFDKKYKPNSYIMASDMNLSSFIFPIELYICNGLICGVKTDYFPDNVFLEHDNLPNIDLDKLVIGREKFIKDLEVISGYGYFLVDLPNNLLFNNDILKAIDTLDYKKRDNAYERNLHMLDIALLSAIDFNNETNAINDHLEFDNAIKILKKKKG